MMTERIWKSRAVWRISAIEICKPSVKVVMILGEKYKYDVLRSLSHSSIRPAIFAGSSLDILMMASMLAWIAAGWGSIDESTAVGCLAEACAEVGAWWAWEE